MMSVSPTRNETIYDGQLKTMQARHLLKPYQPSTDHSETARSHNGAPLLVRPVAIPRIDIAGRLSVPLPFQRAYSPALQSHDVSEAEFLTFIDNLAIAQAPSPLFQAVRVVSMGIGAVPQLWAMATSTGLSVAAGVATAAVSAARTKQFLERSNRDFFGPLGLRVSIKKDAELAAVLRISNDHMPLVPAYENDQYHCLIDRRMRTLAPYLSPITTAVPPPSEQHRNFLDKISSKQIQKRIEKKEKKLREEGDKLREDEEKEATKRAKKQRKRDRKAGRLDVTTDQSIMSSAPDARLAKPSKKAREQMEKDIMKIAKLEYIVVESLQ